MRGNAVCEPDLMDRPHPPVHHVGWVVASIAESRPHFEAGLGMTFLSAEEFPGLKVAFFDGGTIMFELLEPLDADSPMGRLLAERGGGLHHIAFAVEDVAAALDAARARGWAALDEAPRPGSRGTLIGYADPGRPDAVLVQYVQERDR